MFDTKEELLAQIRLGEDSRLELNVAFRGDRVAGPHPDGLAEFGWDSSAARPE